MRRTQFETLGAAFCALICSISQPGIKYTYGYAGNTDNLTSEKREGGSYAGTVTYAYDSLGQLTRVNDPKDTRGGSTGTTWVYAYDRGGNILNKKKYAYTTGTVGTVQQTITYTYNSAWKDKLATYNGTTLSYDAIGNLTGDGTWTYTWAGGRQLSGMSKSGTAITYGYNNSGLRVRKTVAGVVTNYTLNGKLITHLTKGSEWMHFFYDGQGKPSIVNYKGATYRYLYNLQGDVIGLIDTSGNVVVEYKYDAWGKIIGRTGSLASTLGYLNPFRYRGYVYDEETGLYYLRSRYYNPEWGRFINADVLLGKRGAILSHNLFAYCRNCPVSFVDPTGYDATTIPGEGGAAGFVGAGVVIGSVAYSIAANQDGNSIFTQLVDEWNSMRTMCRNVAVTTWMACVSYAELCDNILDQTTEQCKDKFSDGGGEHIHHIVAQNSMKALPARVILLIHDIGINSDDNLIAVDAGKHQVMHTNQYYIYVNAKITAAHMKGGKPKVEEALKGLKTAIGDWTIPF